MENRLTGVMIIGQHIAWHHSGSRPFQSFRLPVDTIRTTEIVKFGPLLHFRDAICDDGVHLGFGHVGHMDVSLGRGFSR